MNLAPAAPPSSPAPPRTLHGARRPALVLVAHGSRDPAAAAEVGRLAAMVAAARPELDVRPAHLGLNAPLLPEVLAGLGGAAVLVPLLLGRGYHAKVDLPAVLAAAPQVDGVVAAPLGPDPLLAELLALRLAQAGVRPGAGPVVLAAAGSREERAALDTEAQAALLGARLMVPVRAGYVTGAGPGVAEVAARLAREHGGPVAVAAYFTAPGDFARLAAAAWDGPAAAPLGAHPLLVRLLLRRYAAAAGRLPAVARPHPRLV
ncbi:CbiX/SirB N-terminal domain-containing protein [Kitasatospora sp. NPDC049258]|uniref:sirohydrochlorin chelatase n=1 Tax=Kitasatospora sp. NPDC049258 TaxID=3155394 RepID=UPI00343B7640